MLTAEILWVDSKETMKTQTRQTKTFNSEEKAIEWCRRNSNHILSINDSGYFLEDTISHFDIMGALRSSNSETTQVHPTLFR